MSDVFDALRLEVGLPTLDELVSRPAWMRDALCAEYPPSWWFSRRRGDVERAKGICRRCLCQDECRVFAVAGPHLEGVWGGTDPRDRRTLRRWNAA